MTHQEGLGCQCEKLREDGSKPLPGPSDEEISQEILRHMALCGSEFPNCGIGYAMRYIFAREANLRAPCPPPSPKDEAGSDEVKEALESGHYSICDDCGSKGCFIRKHNILAAEVRRCHALLKAQGRNKGER